MKAHFSQPILWALLAFIFGASPTAYARSIQDTTGAKIQLVDNPKRIVTLAPSLAELAAALLGDAETGRIVGVTEYTDFPKSLEKTEKVGSYVRFNLEKVVSLKPDLVLATQDGNPRDEIYHLRELGVPVVVVNTGSLSEISASIKMVGAALGKASQGEKMAAELEKGLGEIRKQAALRGPAKRVFLELGDDPLVTAGRGTFLNEALQVVGAANIYGDVDAHYPRPLLEDVLKRDPQAIVILAMGSDLKPFEKMKRSWARFPKMSAERSGAVKVVQGDMILRPTLRLLQGMALLGSAIHGK